MVKGRIVVSVLLLLSFAGCVNFPEIRKFGAISAESTQYTGIVEDNQASLTRDIDYVGDAGATVILEQSLDEARREAPGYRLLLTTVATYMSRLGALADDGQVDYSTEAKALSDNLGHLGASSSDSAAVKSIVSIVGRVTTGLYRGRALESAISDANAPIQHCLIRLENFLDAYSARLANERNLVTAYYRRQRVQMPAESSQSANGLAETLRAEVSAVNEILDRHQRADLSTLEQRNHIATQYRAILKKISDGHAQLYANRDKLSSKQVLAAAKQAYQDIHELRSAIPNI